jgi:UDP-N-acetylglucosamine 2-epimerase (non-hydrolysing)
VLYHLTADADDAPRVAAVCWAFDRSGAFDQRVIDISGCTGTRRALRELGVPAALEVLELRSTSPIVRMGEVLDRGEQLLTHEGTGAALVYGAADTAVAAAIVAMRRGLPVLWVAPGGPFDPADRNQFLLATAADLTFVADGAGADWPNPERVHLVGDTLLDTVRHYARQASARAVWKTFGVTAQNYVLVVLSAARAQPWLQTSIAALAAEVPVLVHLANGAVDGLDLHQVPGAASIGAVGFVDRLSLERGAGVILTDSGRVLQEAAALGIRCHDIGSHQRVMAAPDPAVFKPSPSTPAPCAALLHDSGAADRIARIVLTSYAPMRFLPA